MTVNDPGKFWLFAMAIAGGILIILVAILKSDPASAIIGVGIVGPIIGYMTGNGVLARKGRAPEPTLRSARQQLPSDELSVKRRLRALLEDLDDEDLDDEDLDDEDLAEADA